MLLSLSSCSSSCFSSLYILLLLLHIIILVLESEVHAQQQFVPQDQSTQSACLLLDFHPSQLFLDENFWALLLVGFCRHWCGLDHFLDEILSLEMWLNSWDGTLTQIDYICYQPFCFTGWQPFCLLVTGWPSTVNCTVYCIVYCGQMVVRPAPQAGGRYGDYTSGS